MNGHWRGRNPRRESFSLGLAHGLFCVGCCGALMLVMFAVGLANLAWMAPLTALMVVEKSVRGGEHVRAPVGIVLLALATAVVVRPQLPTWLGFGG